MIPFFQGRYINEQIDHQRWRVFEQFSFTNSKGVVTVVPVGFEHDFASIPPLAQSIISKVGYWSPAAVIHDYHFWLHRSGMEKKRTVWEANQDLLEGCKVMANLWSVPEKDRRHWLIYGGVMAAGPEYWETPKERKARLERLQLHEDILDQ